MLTPVKDTEILRRFSKPPGDLPDTPGKESGGTISVFPSDPLDMPSESFKRAMERREQNRRQLFQWIKKHFKQDIHYGRTHLVENCQYARAGSPHLCRDISHWSRPTLWKAGAEHIINVLGLTAHYPTIHQYEMACVHRSEVTQIILKCELRTSSGKVVAEGSGARHIKQDNWNLNTSIKMAAKSTLIDATIRVAGLSGVFIKTHQNSLTRVGDCNRNKVPGMSDCHRKLHGASGCNAFSIGPVTARQRDFILRIAGHKGVTTEGLEKECKHQFNKGFEDLNKAQASRLIQQLKG